MRENSLFSPFTAWDGVKERGMMHAERQACNLREIPFRKVRYRRETRDFIEFAAFIGRKLPPHLFYFCDLFIAIKGR